MATNLPSITPPFTLPFFYSALSNCVVHYLVNPAVVAPFLTGTVLAPVLFALSPRRGGA
jgi:hypothetical protein